MKKYVVFIISFALLYVIFEIVSGMVITAAYTPDLSLTAQDRLSGDKVEFGTFSVIHWVTIFLAATIAYLLSQKFPWRKRG
ncbi:hypothetical protein F3157_14105 [Virgibacillus dakarensis]|uniref:Uncharacterized protein n=1 Tax=Lentibacillus populi TaxID=1827502 RepID=A0A9W5TXC8_9BACI|nr:MULTISPECIES: hypothetical protein [Bacillaceae]MBT2217279.1 hypothetical protein [Virgibacillus dakarensis]MTW86786.1 hypothetical protein [Virgibacillus dakarensis]GGB38331.1 hypothetical protein GCM10011409_14790 [Lentibacillus populi]